MKIVADIDVPFLKGILEQYGEVVYKKGPDINSEDVKDADALILRTRTRCNQLCTMGWVKIFNDPK